MGGKDSPKPLFISDQAASHSALEVGEAYVLVGSEKETNHVTRFTSSVSRKERWILKNDKNSGPFRHSWRKHHTHLDFITVNGEGNSGFFECGIKPRDCCFQRVSVGARNEHTEDQNLSRGDFSFQAWGWCVLSNSTAVYSTLQGYCVQSSLFVPSNEICKSVMTNPRAAYTCLESF